LAQLRTAAVRQWRTYSITSPVSAIRHIDITVKAVEGGVVSTHLVRSVQPGTIVHLDQANGNFTLTQLPPKALFGQPEAESRR
jgi:stearoyl-CoA 9-desaturase NADPH oxidoreductase